VTRSSETRSTGGAVRWLSVIGTRPQYVKLAPICRAIAGHNENADGPRIEHKIVDTGQHYDREMAELPIEQMKLPTPGHNLNVGSCSAGTQLARMLERLEPVLISERPDWVIVYGDTNSTLAGALMAARLKLSLAHVEAGCRSADMSMPEEQSRLVADHLSRLLLAPSLNALENLLREGIGGPEDPRKRRAALVGDVMHDAMIQNLEIAAERAEAVLTEFGLKSRGYYLMTLHRAENTDSPAKLRAIIQAVGILELPILFPVHPRTTQAIASAGISVNGVIRPVAPQGYIEMLVLEKHAKKILTDSGGVQKEAFYLQVPCVTLRDRSEWPETVACGANRIAGSSADEIRLAVSAEDQISWNNAAPYGHGNAAQKIVAELLNTAGF